MPSQRPALHSSYFSQVQSINQEILEAAVPFHARRAEASGMRQASEIVHQHVILVHA